MAGETQAILDDPHADAKAIAKAQRGLAQCHDGVCVFLREDVIGSHCSEESQISASWWPLSCRNAEKGEEKVAFNRTDARWTLQANKTILEAKKQLDQAQKQHEAMLVPGRSHGSSTSEGKLRYRPAKHAMRFLVLTKLWKVRQSRERRCPATAGYAHAGTDLAYFALLPQDMRTQFPDATTTLQSVEAVEEKLRTLLKPTGGSGRLPDAMFGTDMAYGATRRLSATELRDG
eukprot:3941709-Rhodomonas_salina.4